MMIDSVACKSRVGSKPIQIPAGVNFQFSQGLACVKGPLGEFTHRCPDCIDFHQDNSSLIVIPKSNRAQQSWGTIRSVIANAVQDVATQYCAALQIDGVGYKAEYVKADKTINLPLSGNVIDAIKCGAEDVKNNNAHENMKAVMQGVKFTVNKVRNANIIHSGIRFALNKSHRDLLYDFVREDKRTNAVSRYTERAKDGKLIDTILVSYVPNNISIEILKDGVELNVVGVDRALVGDVAAKIIGLRAAKRDRYKANGISLKGSIIILKEGKQKK